ncbi:MULTISPECIES: phage integrase family protein [unclassified Variovorax]|uniref:phage integrase family protein n=1 Tax=unclassified Variovorax TaxID=663243 RepID=UPI001BD3EB06|nr:MULTISPECIES: phage integrase family protein [unclassified Variovorax]
MRALLQGLDERESWNRYLRGDGATADLRTIRHTIAEIRDAFAAAARREARPGMARLVRLDPERFSAAAKSFPTLESFAAERGLEDFSEAEQAEAYAEAYPDALTGGSERARRGCLTQRSRVIAQQLDALRWLESHMAPDPRPGDDVKAWLNPAVASRLHRCDLRTLGALVAHIHLEGARWWRRVPGVGLNKAARVVAWLDAHAHIPALRLQAHVRVPHGTVPPALRSSVVAPATALLPLEKLRVPEALDGRLGQYRASPEHCLLRAANDPAAIAAWLEAKGGAPSGKVSATFRAYRKEAERLLLWCVLVRGKALSSLSLEDAQAYGAFLADPPPEWCGPRHQQRWSPRWRPLEGPLSPAARRHALTVLKGLFAYLVGHRYLSVNPFVGVAPAPRREAAFGAHRMLSVAQWDRLEALLDRRADPADRVGGREGVEGATGASVARALRWLYATGLRISELAAARCGDLERVEPATAHGAFPVQWHLAVEGKGTRRRQVPVPAALVAELEMALSRHLDCGDLRDPACLAIPVLVRFARAGAAPRGWSSSGLAKAIKTLLIRLSKQCDAGDAANIRKASAHWLRHSHGAHALTDRPGRLAQPVELVRRHLGHASSTTTAAYRARAGATEPT